MTTTVTKDQLETLSSNDNGQAVSETKKYTGEFEGKFIGTLVGNATTAKQLEQPYNFSLSGDAEGTVAVNASSVVLNTTVNHATEADTADFAGKTNLAARATLADMANTAEFAYRAGRLSNLLIKLHGGVTGSGQLTNADTMDIAISGVDVSYFFIFSALPERNPDITKAYVDLSGHHFWIYDTANTVWKDAYDYLLKTLELHGQRLDVLEQSKTTNTADIETLKSTVSQHGAKLTNHEDRITVNERGISAHDARITTNATDISTLDRRLTAAEQLNTSQSESLTDHERRIGNIETTTDVGQISVRIQAIEDKNVEQDTALDNETKARVAKENLLDAKDTELTNALADEQQAREQKDTSLETKNTEQDGRLDAIETKNTEQDNKIKTNTTNINANANSISGLNSQVTEINSHISKLVTVDTAQEISASKTFAGDDTATLNLRSNVIDLDNPASISLNGKNLFFSDKKNRQLGSVYSGVYNGTGFDGVFTRLQVCNEKSTGVNNTPYLEVQARNSGLNAAFAPSNISHSYLTEIATVDWVFQTNAKEGGINYVIGNNLQIATCYFFTVNGGFKTVTFPAPFLTNVNPYIFLTPFISQGDTRLFTTQILNLTTTSVQIACSTSGILIECYYHMLVVGVKA